MDHWIEGHMLGKLTGRFYRSSKFISWAKSHFPHRTIEGCGKGCGGRRLQYNIGQNPELLAKYLVMFSPAAAHSPSPRNAITVSSITKVPNTVSSITEVSNNVSNPDSSGLDTTASIEEVSNGERICQKTQKPGAQRVSSARTALVQASEQAHDNSFRIAREREAVIVSINRLIDRRVTADSNINKVDVIKQFLAAFNDGSLFRFKDSLSDSLLEPLSGSSSKSSSKSPSNSLSEPLCGSLSESLSESSGSGETLSPSFSTYQHPSKRSQSPDSVLPSIWVRRETLEIVGTVSLGTYYRWRSAYAQAGVKGLLPGALYWQGRNEKGKGRRVTGEGENEQASIEWPGYQPVGRKPLLSYQARREICAMLFENPRRKTTAIYHYLQLQRPESLTGLSTTGEVPSYPTIHRFVRQLKIKHRSAFDYILSHCQGRSKWKGKHQLAIGDASAGICWPNERWEIDSSPADIICKGGRRMKLIGLVDIRSRRAIVRLFPESSGWGIAQTLRAGFLTWGIPQEMLRDNGLDYQSKLVNQILDELEIAAPRLPKYAPEKKPHVERFFGTLTGGLFAELSGYTGNSVANRPTVIIEKYTPDELQVIINNYLANIYEETPHSELNGMRPLEVFHTPGWVAKRIDERQLDILLMPCKPAKVRKETIRYNNCLYYAPDLVNYEGQKLEIRIDLQDASRVYVFEPKNSPGPDAVENADGEFEQIHEVARKAEARFVCIARDPAAAGLTPGEIKKAQHRQTKHIEQIIVAQTALNTDLAKAHGYDHKKDNDWRMQERLKQAGRKKPVQISGPDNEAVDLNRYKGIVEAVEAMGVEGIAAIDQGEEKGATGASKNNHHDSQQVKEKVSPRRPDLFGSARERYEWCYERILEGTQSSLALVTAQDRTFMAEYEQTELYQRNRDYYDSLARMYKQRKLAAG